MIALASATLLSLVLGFIFIRQYYSSRRNYTGLKSFDEIPGPYGVPIIGNISDFFKGEAEIWKIVRQRALQYYPIYKLKMFNKHTVTLLDPEDIERILSSDISKTKKGEMYQAVKKYIGNGLTVLEGQTWYRRRKMLTKCFHFNTLMGYIHIFNNKLNLLMNTIQKNINQPMTVEGHLAEMTLRVISASIFNEKFEISSMDHGAFRESVKTVTKATGIKSSKPHLGSLFKLTNMEKTADDAVGVIRNFSYKALKENYETKKPEDIEEGKKLFDVLLRNPQVFDKEAIVQEINIFMVAGYDTTSIGLSYALLALANHPQYQEEIYKEIIEVVGENDEVTFADLKNMNYLERFLKECMRMFPPITFISRELTDEFITKSNYKLTAGTMVLIFFYDLHHNPHLFPHPERFDPDRFLPDNSKQRHPFAYIPFGAGQRNCIAQKFAFLEMKNAICKLVQRFKLEAVDKIEDLVFIPDLVLRSQNGVKVKFLNR